MIVMQSNVYGYFSKINEDSAILKCIKEIIKPKLKVKEFIA